MSTYKLKVLSAQIFLILLFLTFWEIGYLSTMANFLDI